MKIQTATTVLSFLVLGAFIFSANNAFADSVVARVASTYKGGVTLITKSGKKYKAKFAGKLGDRSKMYTMKVKPRNITHCIIGGKKRKAKLRGGCGWFR